MRYQILALPTTEKKNQVRLLLKSQNNKYKVYLIILFCDLINGWVGLFNRAV